MEYGSSYVGVDDKEEWKEKESSLMEGVSCVGINDKEGSKVKGSSLGRKSTAKGPAFIFLIIILLIYIYIRN